MSRQKLGINFILTSDTIATNKAHQIPAYPPTRTVSLTAVIEGRLRTQYGCFTLAPTPSCSQRRDGKLPLTPPRVWLIIL